MLLYEIKNCVVFAISVKSNNNKWKYFQKFMIEYADTKKRLKRLLK